MAKILITYYSRGGNTKEMAQAVQIGVEQEKVDCRLKAVDEVNVKELVDYDGIIIGSPTYYGDMASEIKKLLDESVSLHGQLSQKVGGAFTSSANIGGGNETTILSILKALLVHGMVIAGSSSGDHYGPVSIGLPDKRARKQCIDLGVRTAQLVKKLF
jgi:NAD(P)H dehydrogenase (quinone)